MIMVFLRREASSNYFRTALSSIIEDMSGEHTFISSYAIQESNNYSASAELSQWINRSIQNNSQQRITFLKGYKHRQPNNNLESSLRTYRITIDTINSNIQNLNSDLDIRYYIKRDWHAKIVLKTKRVGPEIVPVAAIVGSSNLTQPALGLSPIFNSECDVLIVNRNYIRGEQINNFIENIVNTTDSDQQNRRSDILILRPYANYGGMSINDILNSLRQQCLGFFLDNDNNRLHFDEISRNSDIRQYADDNIYSVV